jgi:hypothetical protein
VPVSDGGLPRRAGDPVRAENHVHAGQVACQNSWTTPPTHVRVACLPKFAVQLSALWERLLRRRGAAWGANWEQICAPNGPELHSTALNGTALTCGSHISAGQCMMPSLVHTEEVTGSIPVSPTLCFCWSDGLSMIFIGRPFLILGSKWGARPPDHTCSPKCSGRFPCYSYISAAGRAVALLPMIAADGSCGRRCAFGWREEVRSLPVRWYPALLGCIARGNPRRANPVPCQKSAQHHPSGNTTG